MKNSIKEIARELYKQEYSPKEAAVELVGQASQSSVYRWFDEFTSEDDFLSGVVDDEIPADLGDVDSADEPGNIDEEYEEESELGEVEGDDENVIDEEAREINSRKIKRGIEKKTKKLFNSILSHSSSFEWSHQQINKMLRSLDSVQDQIEFIFGYDPDEYKLNAFWVYLESFVALFQAYSNAGGVIEINFEREILDEIDAILGVEEFDSVYSWGAIFEAGFSRLKNDLNEIDGQKLDSDATYEYEKRISDLVAELEENDSELAYTNEMSILKGLKKDFKRLSDTIDESFWGSAMFVLDEDLQISKK